jgi:hypothetical protein
MDVLPRMIGYATSYAPDGAAATIIGHSLDLISREIGALT